MGYNEIFNEIISQLSKDAIINGAMKDNEMPMGFLLTYIKDMYNISKPQGWKIAEAVLRYFGIENKMYSLQEHKSKVSKNAVSINESQLRKLIAEKIKKVLKEDESDIYRIHNDRMTSFEKQMERLEWAIQDKERELEKLKQQRDQLQIDYEDDIQNFTDRGGDYSNSH